MAKKKFGTHEERVYNWLVNLELDPITAWSRLGIYRLAAVIHVLRGPKWKLNIETHKKIVLNRFGEECEVAEYKLIRQAQGTFGFKV